jgi:hypothetical protein
MPIEDASGNVDEREDKRKRRKKKMGRGDVQMSNRERGVERGHAFVLFFPLFIYFKIPFCFFYFRF